MTVARACHSAVVLPDGKLLAIGGEVDPQMYEGTSTYSKGAGLPSTEILDPVNGSWTAGAPR